MGEKEMVSTKNISLGVSRFIKDNGPKFIDDLTSDMLHIENCDPITNARHVSLLTETGHKIRKGKWTKEETALLKKNFDTYVNDNNIDDPFRLVTCKSDRKIRETIKKTSFHSVVCRNLNRSTKTIYHKLKFGLVCKGKGGGFTEQEDKQLRHLLKKHGKNFAKIASVMNRNFYNVFNRYLMNKKKNCIKGHWSEKEVSQLLHGLKTVMRTNDIDSLRHRFDIKWMKVSKYVKTRNYIQCHQYFRMNKKFKLQSSLSISQRWKKQHTILLIDNLYNINCDDESDIDWIELNQLFTDVSPGAAYLQQKFACLKARTEDFNRKSYEEIIEKLREKYCSR